MLSWAPASPPAPRCWAAVRAGSAVTAQGAGSWRVRCFLSFLWTDLPRSRSLWRQQCQLSHSLAHACCPSPCLPTCLPLCVQETQCREMPDGCSAKDVNHARWLLKLGVQGNKVELEMYIREPSTQTWQSNPWLEREHQGRSVWVKNRRESSLGAPPDWLTEREEGAWAQPLSLCVGFGGAGAPLQVLTREAEGSGANWKGN